MDNRWTRCGVFRIVCFFFKELVDVGYVNFNFFFSLDAIIGCKNFNRIFVKRLVLVDHHAHHKELLDDFCRFAVDLLCNLGNVHADRINQSFRQRLVLALRNGVLLIIVALIAIIALVVFAIVLLVELALFVVVSAETIVALSFRWFYSLTFDYGWSFLDQGEQPAFFRLIACQKASFRPFHFPFYALWPVFQP